MRITRRDERRSRTYTPDLPTARKSKPKERIQIPRFVPYLIACILLVVAGVFVMRLDRLQLGEVVIEGAKSEDQDRLRSVVEGELSGSYAWVIPRRNIFIYSEPRIREALEFAAPRLEAVSVEQTELRRLVVRVVERAPVAIACTENYEECHFVDHRGFLFARAPHISGDLFFGLALPLHRLVVGGQAMDVESFQRFLEARVFLNGALGAMPYVAHVSRLIETSEDGTPRFAYEVISDDVKMEPWRIIVPERFDIVELAGRVTPAFETLAADARKLDAKHLEYVDVRFGNRVFYRYR